MHARLLETLKIPDLTGARLQRVQYPHSTHFRPCSEISHHTQGNGDQQGKVVVIYPASNAEPLQNER